MNILRDFFTAYFWSLVLCGTLTLFVGCKTRYIEVERVKTDSVFVSVFDTIRESNTIYVEIEKRDSVHEREYTDSLGIVHNDRDHYIFNSKVEDKNREKEVITQVEYIEVKGDSIPYPVVVEKELSKWEKFKLDMGELFMTIALVGVIICGILLYLKRK